jgi:hypothetical protein
MQLTYALYHAWTEIKHDIFYKPDVKMIKRHQKLINKLKREIKKVMVKHIQEASDLFETVIEKVRDIRNQKITN